MPNSPVCNILLLNKDETPMYFVVWVLQDFFDLDFDEANKLMLRVHHEGKAICGSCEREEAERRGIQHSGVCGQARPSAQMHP
jgi:ATP-dependent Clp protease adaptor protein ClpS